MGSLRRVVCAILVAIFVVLSFAVVVHTADAALLTVQIDGGLPAGEAPLVILTGPAGFHKVIHRSTTLPNLPNGRYTAIAERVTFKRTTGSGSIAGFSAVGLVAAAQRDALSRNLVFSVGKTVFSLSELPHHQINVWYTAVVPNGGPVFSQLVPGERYCGLRRHGGIVTCWGNYAPLTPAGAFTQVSSSGFSLCGLRPNGTITCWGSYPPDDLLHPPRGVFAQVAVAESGAFACGLHRNGTVQCWWAGKLSGSFFLPTGTFTRIAVSGDESGIGRSYIGLGPTVCGLLADRTVACSTGQYYENSPGMSTITIPAVRFSLAGTFSQLVGGFDTLCGLHTDGTTACVSRGNPNDMSVPLAGMYTELAEGGNDICGVATDGSVDCEVVYQALPAPPGVFIQILPGDDYDCGLHPDGTVTCWVNSNPPKISPSDGGGDVPTQ